MGQQIWLGRMSRTPAENTLPAPRLLRMSVETRVCGMKVPVTGQRFRIEKEERSGAGIRLRARGHKPPQPITLPGGCIDESAFE